jgi:hypothetical protein
LFERYVAWIQSRYFANEYTVRALREEHRQLMQQYETEFRADPKNIDRLIEYGLNFEKAGIKRSRSPAPR